MKLVLDFDAGTFRQIYKTGRLPARRPEGLKDLTDYVKLPPAPPAAHWGHGLPFNMDGNDTYGDCTIAGSAHMILAWDREVKSTDPVPSSDECVSQYLDLTGGQDTGLVEADLLKTWQTRGLFTNLSSKLAAYAPITLSNLDSLKQAIAFYGGAYLGVNLPESAEQQFPNPWTVVPGSPIAGGHCIVATGYDEKWLYCVSWGQIVSVAWDWYTAYTEEAWCLIPEQFVQAGRGPLSAADLVELQADLASV